MWKFRRRAQSPTNEIFTRDPTHLTLEGTTVPEPPEIVARAYADKQVLHDMENIRHVPPATIPLADREFIDTQVLALAASLKEDAWMFPKVTV